jgi:hypothetical protein
MATRFIDGDKWLMFDHATQFFTASIRTAAGAAHHRAERIEFRSMMQGGCIVELARQVEKLAWTDPAARLAVSATLSNTDLIIDSS